jgi:hypothetical protein
MWKLLSLLVKIKMGSHKSQQKGPLPSKSDLVQNSSLHLSNLHQNFSSPMPQDDGTKMTEGTQN